MAEEYFRAGVGMVVIRDGLVLALQRADRHGSWQTLQGGLQPNEVPLDAAQRELAEETGIAWGDIEVVAEYPEWLAYELPAVARGRKVGRGQVQRWYLLRHHGSDADIHLTSNVGAVEFLAWRWMSLDELIAAVWDVKRPTYRRWALEWRTLIE